MDRPIIVDSDSADVESNLGNHSAIITKTFRTHQARWPIVSILSHTHHPFL